MADVNEFEKAVDALETCCKLCKISFDLRYRDGQSSIYTRTWNVKTMGKKFTDRDFVVAIREAISFVVKAHPEKFAVLNETEKTEQP
jgi:hypothetical protein